VGGREGRAVHGVGPVQHVPGQEMPNLEDPSRVKSSFGDDHLFPGLREDPSLRISTFCSRMGVFAPVSDAVALRYT
jgi:hypothetical protein